MFRILKDHVGEISYFRNRVILHTQHLQNVENALLPVSHHKSQCTRDIFPNFNVMLICKMQNPDRTRKIEGNLSSYTHKLFYILIKF